MIFKNIPSLSRSYLFLFIAFSSNIFCSNENPKKDLDIQEAETPLVALAKEIKRLEQETATIDTKKQLADDLRTLEHVLEKKDVNLKGFEIFVTPSSFQYSKDIATVYQEVQRAATAHLEKPKKLTAKELQKKYAEIGKGLKILKGPFTSKKEEIEKTIINDIIEFTNNGGSFTDDAYQQNQGIMLLFETVLAKSLPVFKALIEIGNISPNTQQMYSLLHDPTNTTLTTPLRMLISLPKQDFDTDIFNYLLSLENIEIDKRDSHGFTPLFAAGLLAHAERDVVDRNHYLDITQKLIQKGANTEVLQPLYLPTSNSYDTQIARMVNPALQIIR